MAIPAKLLNATMGVVTFRISAVTGTATPTLYAWLEAKDTAQVQYFPLFYDQRGTEPATPGDDLGADLNRKNVTGTGGATVAGRHTAIYKHLPAMECRLRWRVTGTFSAGQGFTVSAGMDVA